MAPDILDDDGRRRFARLEVGIGARFTTLAGDQPVRLVNLSQNGAKLILSAPEDAGAGVLTWLDFETFGDLAWQDEDTIGIVFDKLLRPGILAQTRLRAPTVVREEEAGLAKAWVSGEIGDN
jgi:hypothetical protein